MGGLYCVLWGKSKESKETKEKEATALPLAALKGVIEGNAQILELEVDEVEAEKAKTNNKRMTSSCLTDSVVVAVVEPVPEAFMKVKEEYKS